MSVAVTWAPSQGLQVRVPTALILGGHGPDSLQRGARLVDDTPPDSSVVVLEGQQHLADLIVPQEFARIVVRFLNPDGTVATST